MLFFRKRTLPLFVNDEVLGTYQPKMKPRASKALTLIKFVAKFYLIPIVILEVYHIRTARNENINYKRIIFILNDAFGMDV